MSVTKGTVKKLTTSASHSWVDMNGSHSVQHCPSCNHQLNCQNPGGGHNDDIPQSTLPSSAAETLLHSQLLPGILR